MLILKKQADAEVKDTRERLLGDRRAELEHYVQIAMGSNPGRVRPLGQRRPECPRRGHRAPVEDQVRQGRLYLRLRLSVVRPVSRGDSPVRTSARAPRPPRSQRRLPQPRTGGGRPQRQPLRDLYLAAAGQRERHGAQASYTLYLPKWDMVIGSAINPDGVEAQLVEIKQDIDERIGT
ncbi:hypothetical protein ACPA9J_00610 [Pseudomonas aeruginosa]